MRHHSWLPHAIPPQKNSPTHPTMDVYQKYLRNLSGKILLGCDGFVDETYELVKERTSATTYTPYNHLKGFGELILERADGGVGLELMPKRRCEGGFAINTGRIAGCLGLNPVLPGLYGQTTIDPAYEDFQDICQLISLGDPGLTIALEFADGKILMSDIQAVSTLTWPRIAEHIGATKLAEIFKDVDIIGLGYWSLTTHFDEILEGFMGECRKNRAPRRMFFDFADIKKKSKPSFLASLDLIRSHNQTIPATFSLNEHEVMELFTRVGVSCADVSPASIVGALALAREKVGLDELVVHTPDFAAASSASEGEAVALQEKQSKVIRLAGAGDSFNGGYLCASLGDLPLKQRLVMANATTAFFVTHATGPNKDQLLAQIAKASDR